MKGGSIKRAALTGLDEYFCYLPGVATPGYKHTAPLGLLECGAKKVGKP